MKALESQENLEEWFSKLTSKQLRDLCVRLHLLAPLDMNDDDDNDDNQVPESKVHLITLLTTTHVRPFSPLHSITNAPPKESEVWNTLNKEYDGASYAVWKMTLQNICMEDYLVRNYELFLLEQKYV